jgi:stress response protein YsnF
MNNTTIDIHAKEASQRVRKITSLLESLRKKVKSFAVLDKQRQIIGYVQDLVINANLDLNFVISQIANQEKNRFFLLKGKEVEKIDSRTHSVLTKLEKFQIQNLPEYNIRKHNKVSDMNENTNAQNEINDHITYASANEGTVSVIPENIETAEQEIIRLLGEKLIVDRTKRKIGEVIVRKEIETRMIQVPVRREKLIVEQVGSEHKQLAEIDLGEEEISKVYLAEGETRPIDGFNNSLSVTGEFNSPKIASLLLNAIALEQNHGCKKVRVTIFVEDEEHQKKYQEWFARTSKS